MAIIRSDVEIHWSSELKVFCHYFSGVELNSKEDNFECEMTGLAFQRPMDSDIGRLSGTTGDFGEYKTHAPGRLWKRRGEPAFHSSRYLPALAATELRIRIRTRILTTDGTVSCTCGEWCHGHGTKGPPLTNERVERGRLRRNLLDHTPARSGSDICLSDRIVRDDDDSIRVLLVLRNRGDPWTQIKRRHPGSWIHPKGSDEFSLIRTGEEERRPDLINLNDTSGHGTSGETPDTRKRRGGDVDYRGIAWGMGARILKGGSQPGHGRTNYGRRIYVKRTSTEVSRYLRGPEATWYRLKKQGGKQWHGDARRRCLMDGAKGHGLRSVRGDTLESVNEIHAIGLYDKCRARHRVKGKPSSRSSQMRKGMVPFAGCEYVNRWKRRVKSKIWILDLSRLRRRSMVAASDKHDLGGRSADRYIPEKQGTWIRLPGKLRRRDGRAGQFSLGVNRTGVWPQRDKKDGERGDGKCGNEGTWSLALSRAGGQPHEASVAARDPNGCRGEVEESTRRAAR
ncbi:hypothetical protein EDB89DRAFT_1902786 [Lactarius sanguifluus]|nr:hypothetical protein EDB89DRAFT_1902786 [Lactarius sanguifluus]